MTDKFVLPAKHLKPSTNAHGEVVRVSMDAYNLLVEMANCSSIPVGRITSKAIEYAYNNLSLEEEES